MLKLVLEKTWHFLRSAELSGRSLLGLCTMPVPIAWFRCMGCTEWLVVVCPQATVGHMRETHCYHGWGDNIFFLDAKIFFFRCSKR